MTNHIRQIRNQVRAEQRARQQELTAFYLIFRVSQHESDETYPHLQQQQRVLLNVVEQVEEDFPLEKGEAIVFHRSPDCGNEYVGVRLKGEVPTEKQLAYLASCQIFQYEGEVVSYEVIPGPLFKQRKKKKIITFGVMTPLMK